MKNFKSLLALALALAMVLCFVACTDNKGDGDATTVPSTAPSTEPSSEPIEGSEPSTEVSEPSSEVSEPSSEVTEPSVEPSTPVEFAYVIKVVDANGNPVAGAWVQMCDDTGCRPAQTNANGIAGYVEGGTGKLKAQLLNAEGYNKPAEDIIYFENGITEVTFVVTAK